MQVSVHIESNNYIACGRYELAYDPNVTYLWAATCDPTGRHSTSLPPPVSCGSTWTCLLAEAPQSNPWWVDAESSTWAGQISFGCIITLLRGRTIPRDPPGSRKHHRLSWGQSPMNRDHLPEQSSWPQSRGRRYRRMWRLEYTLCWLGETRLRTWGQR